MEVKGRKIIIHSQKHFHKYWKEPSLTGEKEAFQSWACQVEAHGHLPSEM